MTVDLIADLDLDARHGCSTTVLLLAAQTVVGIRLNTITRQSSSAVILFFIKNTSSFH